MSHYQSPIVTKCGTNAFTFVAVSLLLLFEVAIKSRGEDILIIISSSNSTGVKRAGLFAARMISPLNTLFNR